MTLPATAALLVTLAALFSYLNYRFVHLPGTIGMMLIALCLSAGILALGKLGIPLDALARQALSAVDFDQTLMAGMLSFLLFGGALQTNLDTLAEQKLQVGFLAFVGVLLSTALVGLGMHYALAAAGQPIPLVWCLAFGALISPTDPVAVLAIVRAVGAPKSLEMKIAGESLFNDGVGIVLFVEIVSIATGQGVPSATGAALFFAREALGGIAFGLALGYVGYRLLRSVDDYEVEVLITVALVMGGYAAATALGVSGPISIVVAGLLIGSHGRRFAMSQRTRERLDDFWELVDSILNAVLFVLIGLEMLLLPFDASDLLPALLAIPIVLLARFVSVVLPAWMPFLHAWFDRRTGSVLAWGGLRGGIAVALALALPPTPHRQTLIAMTYACVVFSILVQGLTIGPMVRAWSRRRESATREERDA